MNISSINFATSAKNLVCKNNSAQKTNFRGTCNISSHSDIEKIPGDRTRHAVEEIYKKTEVRKIMDRVMRFGMYCAKETPDDAEINIDILPAKIDWFANYSPEDDLGLYFIVNGTLNTKGKTHPLKGGVKVCSYDDKPTKLTPCQDNPKRISELFDGLESEVRNIINQDDSQSDTPKTTKGILGGLRNLFGKK